MPFPGSRGASGCFRMLRLGPRGRSDSGGMGRKLTREKGLGRGTEGDEGSAVDYSGHGAHGGRMKNRDTKGRRMGAGTGREEWPGADGCARM